jgi:hypothetical protein
MRNPINNFHNILLIVKHSLKNRLNSDGNLPKAGRKPKFSDAEVLALSILMEILMIDSENYLFVLLNKFKQQIPHLISRPSFNRRRRKLAPLMEEMRRNIVNQVIPYEDAYIVDSMPLPICRFTRAKRVRICRESYETAPAFGYSTALGNTFYGYKLHIISSVTGVVTHFDLSKGNEADIHYIRQIQNQYQDCLILGDRGYLNESLQMDLFIHRGIQLETPKRINQKKYQTQRPLYRRFRKRIETIFSQLVDQFNLQKNYAKTFAGFSTRILAKITGFTILQYLNKYEKRQNLNHVKHVLV